MPSRPKPKTVTYFGANQKVILILIRVLIGIGREKNLEQQPVGTRTNINSN